MSHASRNNNLVSKNICIFHTYSYCKYGSNCRKIHNTDICPEGYTCPDTHCTKRHPKVCYYFNSTGRCKFGSSCTYLHESHITDTLKTQLQELKEEIQYLKQSNTDLKLIVQDFSRNIETRAKNTIECGLCDQTFSSASGRTRHRKVKHSIDEKIKENEVKSHPKVPFKPPDDNGSMENNSEQEYDRIFRKEINLEKQKEDLIAAACFAADTTAEEHNLTDQIKENKIGWSFKWEKVQFPLYQNINVLPIKIKIYHRRDKNAQKYHLWSEKPKKEKREFKRRHFYLIIKDLDINIKLIPLEIHFIHQPKLKKIEDRNYDKNLWLESKMIYLPDLHPLVQTKVDSDGSDRSDRGSPPPGHRPSRPATRDQRPSSACSCTTQ